MLILRYSQCKFGGENFSSEIFQRSFRYTQSCEPPGPRSSTAVGLATAAHHGWFGSIGRLLFRQHLLSGASWPA
jgi:hypothetical protein